MVYVTVNGDTQGALERALTEFTRKVRRADIMYDLRIHQHFETRREKRIRRFDDRKRRNKKSERYR